MRHFAHHQRSPSGNRSAAKHVASRLLEHDTIDVKEIDL
jgi:hypothetical protein